MTTLRTAAQQALEALVIAEAALADIGDADREPGDDLAWCEARAAQALEAPRTAITAVRAALEQPEQEPAWRLSCGCPSQYGGIPAEWPETTREGGPAVAYGVVCEKHWHEYGAQHPR